MLVSLSWSAVPLGEEFMQEIIRIVRAAEAVRKAVGAVVPNEIELAVEKLEKPGCAKVLNALRYSLFDRIGALGGIFKRLGEFIIRAVVAAPAFKPHHYPMR